MTGFAVVVPTIGRPSLDRLLETLAAQEIQPAEVVLADDRPSSQPAALAVDWPVHGPPLRVVRTYGRGPAAARNAGWRSARAASAEWIAFLDDDVELLPGWSRALIRDLSACTAEVAATQGRLHVPLPDHRRPTDWERGTHGLETAAWATADMAYRRGVLAGLGGFDERFPRAYREDADLALRAQRAGHRLVRGTRTTIHPVRPADDWVSVRLQRGNADDVLMRALHGPDWRAAGQVPAGRLRWHLATVAAGLAGLAALAGRRPRAGLALLGLWAGLTAQFAWTRLRPGPRPGESPWWPELRRMVLTSVAIPWAAAGHRLRGTLRWRREPVAAWPLPVRAVLFDRDGTLVHDVPYNGDPAAVRLTGSAIPAVAAARRAGLATGVVTNQSGIARGLITRAQAEAVNQEIDRQLGGLGSWQLCPHDDTAGCACRKPGPLLVQRAAAALGVRPQECVVIGDIGADIGAARAAGARAVLVPTAATRPEEIEDAGLVAPDLLAAVELALGLPAEQPAGAR